MKPHVTRAMDYLDKDGQDDNGIPAGGSTYDYEQLPRGEFIYSASCYLGAHCGPHRLWARPPRRPSYDGRLAKTQAAVMADLWNGAFFRKWKSPTTPQVNENSFVANLAGDWAGPADRSAPDAAAGHPPQNPRRRPSPGI